MYYKLLKLKNRVYDAAQIDWDHMMFDRSAIWKLLIPLMIENLLASFMGMADSMMVTRIGSAAISAVSLTDAINNLIIQLFSAMATGGTILCSQYIGSGDPKKANAAARQVVLSMTSIAIVITLFAEALNGQLLRLVFGSVEPAVLSAAETYFRFTAASFPFLGLYQIGAAFYRAGGNSRFPMRVSVISNVMNIIGNAIFIFGFGWGVAGAALSTLLSRILAAIILFVFLRKPKQVIVVREYLIRPDFDMIARILTIGIPSGIENSMFQFGKLAIQSSVSTLGTTAIAAQAMAIIFENINGIGGLAVGIGLMTMVGQTLGAGRKEEAKYYIVHLMDISNWIIIISCVLTFAACKPVMWLAGMEPEAAKICYDMVIFITISKIFVWVPSFLPSYGLRAAGDVRFTMIVSSLSMWITRVAMVTYLIRVCGMGPIAVWIGMASDWCVRGAFFLYRFMSGKWLSHSVIEHDEGQHSKQ